MPKRCGKSYSYGKAGISAYKKALVAKRLKIKKEEINASSLQERCSNKKSKDAL